MDNMLITTKYVVTHSRPPNFWHTNPFRNLPSAPPKVQSDATLAEKAPLFVAAAEAEELVMAGSAAMRGTQIVGMVFTTIEKAYVANIARSTFWTSGSDPFKFSNRDNSR
mmetsp:Transcript_711/g.658  ORF Transcript_711/g.658 Transcript_711/m.658 type:complete len:110 (-) Transcript_711:267-596(-)